MTQGLKRLFWATAFAAMALAGIETCLDAARKESAALQTVPVYTIASMDDLFK